MKYNREYAFKYTGPESIPQDWTLNEDYSFDGSNLICNDMCAVLGNLVGYNLDGDRPIDVLVIQCLDEYEKKEIITTEFQEILEDAEVADVATPVATPEAGEVESGTTVTLSCETEGAVIYYTTDGTDPTSASTEYTEAIEITEEITIKAIAIKEGLDNSKVLSATYTIAGPQIYNVDINDLNTWLSQRDPNSIDNPYLINVTNTSSSDFDWYGGNDDYSKVSSALGDNPTKYVDLSPSIIPNDQTDMKYAFNYPSGIPSLVGVPNIPNSVTNLEGAFLDCNSLETVPSISNNATELAYTFNGCTNLISVPTIYANGNDPVTIHGLFKNCTSLTSVSFIGFNVNNIVASEDFPFEGCVSLEAIYVDSQETKTALYNLCHSLDSTDSIVTEAKIIVSSSSNDSGNGNSGIGTIK